LFAAHAALLLFVLIFSAVRRAHPTAGPHGRQPPALAVSGRVPVAGVPRKTCRFGPRQQCATRADSEGECGHARRI